MTTAPCIGFDGSIRWFNQDGNLDRAYNKPSCIYPTGEMSFFMNGQPYKHIDADGKIHDIMDDLE